MGQERNLELEPCFTLNAQITQEDVGAIEGGYRVDFSYKSSGATVTIVPPASPGGTAAASALGGNFRAGIGTVSLSSGSDWAFVSDEAFIDLDSTITLAVTPPPKSPPAGAQPSKREVKCLLAARLMGRADLRNCCKKDGQPVFTYKDDARAILEKWREGFEADSVLPLTLAVTIEVPTSGLDDDQDDVYRGCLPLGAALLIGVGKATFSGKPNGEVSKIELTVGKPQNGGQLT